ncbi:MAG: DNA mismatch repair protein, partial [Bacteroidetes bacterium]|nr:DNA mismatch repair protein [Bacteroidota bacterium]
MSFTTDQQTLDDLNLSGRRNNNPVYGIFQRTATRQGAAVLEEMFRYPLSDREAIQKRIDIFRWFAAGTFGFPFQVELFDIAEQYLSVTDERTRLTTEPPSTGRRLAGLLAEDNEYKSLQKGVLAVAGILQQLIGMLEALPPGSPYRHEKVILEAILAEGGLDAVLKTDAGRKPSHTVIATYDGLFRFRSRAGIRKILQHIYLLDAYIAVGRVARERGFVFPSLLSPGDDRIILEGVYHPQVNNAVPNTLHITPDNHILFLTGANMAGKSTFMKTLGITLFLAHMGFPVPAKQMSFSVLDG